MIWIKRHRLIVFKIFLFAGTFVSLFYVPWPILGAWLSFTPATIEEQLEKTLDYGFDGVVLYFDQGGQQGVAYAAGWHNKETKVPAKPDALFKIASVSKLYDVVTLTKLVAEGRLSIDKTLVDYLPELKGRIEYADQITLRMMVQHRSGIPNYTDTYRYWAAPKESAQENLALILDQEAEFKPDESYQYCNTNYLLLSLIMDKELGYPHFEYLQEKVLIPLGLNRTYDSLDDIAIEELMSGYYVGYEGDLKTDAIPSIIASAKDVGIFVRALNQGSFFSVQEQELYASLYTYSRTGLIPGYQTIARYVPEHDAVLIQFTNTVNFEGYQWNLSEIAYNKALKILLATH